VIFQSLHQHALSGSVEHADAQCLRFTPQTVQSSAIVDDEWYILWSDLREGGRRGDVLTPRVLTEETTSAMRIRKQGKCSHFLICFRLSTSRVATLDQEPKE
jgi:hypothetical protein